MARIVPENAQGRTAGEKEILSLLKKQLNDDYYVRYEPYLNNKYPDFVIFGPKIGVVILEIKDWSKDYIYQFTRENVVVSGGEKRDNPQKQVIEYSREITKQAKIKENSKFKYPINSIIVFINMSEDDFMDIKDDYNESRLSDFINPQHTLFSQDINALKEQGKNGDLLGCLIEHTKYKPWKFEFTADDAELLRTVLNTNILLRDNVDNTFKMLSEEQERNSQEIPGNHKLLIGNAGSGKSVVLISQIKYILDRLDDIKILMVCFNNVFVDTLRNNLLKDYYETDDKGLPNGNLHIYNSQIAEKSVEEYDFIFIDEGQDIEPATYDSLSKKLKKDRFGHMIIACDGTQNIYDKVFSFNELNLGFKLTDDNLERLTSNYRCTREILMLAESFIDEKRAIIDEGDHEFDSRFTNKANRHRRSGLVPELRISTTDNEEYRAIYDKIKDLFDKGIQANQIAVFTSTNDKIKNLKKFNNNNNGVQFMTLKDGYAEHDYSHKKVALTTYHSSKGLEYDHVIVCGFSKHSLSGKYAKAIYVAMTRARKELFISYSKESAHEDTMNALDNARYNMLENLKYKSKIDSDGFSISAHDVLDYVKCASEIYEHFKGDIVRLIDEIKPYMEETATGESVKVYMDQIHELTMELNLEKSRNNNEKNRNHQADKKLKDEKDRNSELSLEVIKLKEKTSTLIYQARDKDSKLNLIRERDQQTSKQLQTEIKRRDDITLKLDELKKKHSKQEKVKNGIIAFLSAVCILLIIYNLDIIDAEMLFGKPTDVLTQEAHAEDIEESVDNDIVLDLVIKKLEDLDVTSCYIYIRDYETGKEINTFNLPLKSLITIQKKDDGYKLLTKEYVSTSDGVDIFEDGEMQLEKDTIIEFCNINAEINQYNTNTEITPLVGYTEYLNDRAKLLFKVETGIVESYVD